ncbi:hypothetical protein ABZ639_12440 [Saccharomonospora sp. NPDC006951]
MADKVTRVAAGVLAAAAVYAGWGGWSWITATGDDALSYAQARDEALAQGRARVAEVTTLDYHDVDGGIDRWVAASTGPLRDEFAGTGKETKNALRDNGTVATGKVLEAAISELDQDAGTATMLVSVEITTAREGAEPATARNRFTARLQHTGGEWKLSALNQVPLGGAS